MAIVFHCEHCGKKISAPESAGGKPGKCPTCHQRIYIPMPESEIEEIPLAPEDPQDEIRKHQFLREQFLLQQELEKHKGAPEVPGEHESMPAENALPLLDDGDGAALNFSSTSHTADVGKLVEQYVLLMVQGNLEGANQIASQIAAGGKQAKQKVEQMAMQDFFHPDAANIPPSVIAGFFKKLLARFY
jgi:DNA-directed RNA polymerase subunit RPC12/RpoP